jgi:hypothetical protein
MRRIHLLGFSLGLLSLSAALMAADGATDGPVVVESSMHEFMEYVYQPTYLRLKANMAKLTADPAPWKDVKADSLILAESGNLLLMRGPEENRADWNQHAVATRELGAELYKAARAKDAGKAKTAYTEMITRCNACHDDFADGKHQLQP